MNKYFSQRISLAAIGATLLLGACADDDFKNGKYDSDHICFRTENATWGDMADTRAVGNPTDYVLRATGSRDTLCMKQIVTEGIQLDRTHGTRGTQITNASQIQSFGVFAYTQQGGVNKLYINNEQYTKSGNVFESQNIYYWPGASLTFDFYTYSPISAPGLTIPNNADTYMMEYVVPTDVSKQQDLMLAKNLGIKGNYNAAVPLAFTHLLTAVNVVAGEQMVDGTITKIEFTNLVGEGTIDMRNVDPANPTVSPWDTQGVSNNTTYTVNPNVLIDHTAGQNLLGDVNTFLVLPQTLSAEFNSINVDVTASDGTVRHLSAKISGEWKMGTTNTYRLSITPEYDLKFDNVDIPVQDAHYVSFTTNVQSNNLKGKNWKVEVVGCPGATVQFESQVSIYVKEQGFWLDRNLEDGVDKGSARGDSNTLTSNIESPNETIRIFLPENITTADREISVNLYYGDGTTPIATKKVTQKCPAWDGNTGWEVIYDEPTGQWGFDSQGQSLYVFNHSGTSLGDNITKFFNDVEKLYNSIVTEYNATYAKWGTYQYKYNHWGAQDVTYPYILVDYSTIDDLNNGAADNLNGKSNTEYLFNHGGSLYSGAFENAILGLRTRWLKFAIFLNIEDSNYKTELLSKFPDYKPADKGTRETVLTEIIKKNKFNLVTTSEGGDATTTAPKLSADGIVWYMPAVEQFNTMPSWFGTGPDKANLWSSTEGPSTDSPKSAYIGNGTRVSRSSVHAVRAARNR